MRITIALRGSNKARLDDFTAAVTDPSSPRYGQYMSADEVQQLTAPSSVARESVEAWLRTADVKYTYRAATGTFEADGSVTAVQSLLSTHVTELYNIHTEQVQLRGGDVTIPSGVEEHVSAVYGVHGLPLPPATSASSRSSTDARDTSGLPAEVTPKVIASAYDIGGVSVSRGTKNRQAVAEFQGQFMNTTDLATFFERFVPDAQAGDDKVYKFQGGETEGEGVEAQLDIQYIMGVAPGIKTEFWEQKSMDFCSDLKTWTTTLLATSDIPLVHSVSYGWQGELSQIGCTKEEVQDVDTDFQKLAARGITIIFASGDSGSGFTPPQCSENPGTKGVAYSGKMIQALFTPNAAVCCTLNQEIGGKAWTYVEGNPFGRCEVFESKTGQEQNKTATSGGLPPAPTSPSLYASWPASSPWVTAVGATRFIDQKAGPGAEMATDQFGSGGGFDSNFAQPTWQAADVAHYFSVASGLPPSGSYDAKSRGTPDVAALGEGFQVINDGRAISVGGTSAAAPTFAAMVSLLNEARLGAGKAPMGFLNTWLYANADAFTDVTVGNDKVGRGGETLPFGYDCAAGWDPVTGLGTVQFDALLKAAMKATA
jgi:tripeptidyl-peptidase-1